MATRGNVGEYSRPMKHLGYSDTMGMEKVPILKPFQDATGPATTCVCGNVSGYLGCGSGEVTQIYGENKGTG